jgi:pimeloyl-ACP methyl ester carboxylesterase
VPRAPSGSEAEGGAAVYRLTDGAELHFVPFGGGSGPLAVVIPGLSDGLVPLSEPDGRAAASRPPAAFRDHRVVVVSHRHPVPDGWSTEDMAGDVAAFLDEVAGRALVVGHSLGGMVAQHLAAARPDLVARLVLSSTLPCADDALQDRLERWDMLLRQSRWRQFYRAAVDDSFVGVGRLLRRLRLARVPPPPRPDNLVGRHLALSAACRTHDARRVLGRIDAPPLVMAGSDDPVTRPQGAEELAGSVSGARLVVFAGAGHALPEQRRRAYIRTVRAFVDATGP